MPKIRVAWFADIFDEVSGITTDTVEMCMAATLAGYSWFPITCYHKEINPFFVFPPVLRIPTHSIYKNSKIYIPNFLQVINYLKKNKINMIVSNTPAMMGIVAMASAAFLKLPWVDIYHTDVDFYADKLLPGGLNSFKNRAALSFLKLYHKQADLIFVRNRHYYNIILNKGNPQEKICYYPAGVDQDRFHPKHNDRSIWKSFNINPKNKIVLFVGRITKVKDIHFLLDFFASYKNSHTELVIVGEGPEYSIYKEEYGSNKNTYFLGVQQGETLQKIFASADLCVSPSRSETLGKTLLEAMASGTTVLVSDQGGPKDYVQESVNGRIFKAGDYKSFHASLLSFLEEPYEFKEMGEKAHDMVKPYTIERLFNSFLNTLKTLQKKS